MIIPISSSSSLVVSVIVITYNSSKYVLETLESAKNQTYQNIELIVSDDCSTDNTVDICRNWIEQNKERFVRTEMVTSDKNTGIAPNCNRGLKLAEGEWIKLIAGDDILYSHCISSFVDNIVLNEDLDIAFSYVSINGRSADVPKELDIFFSKSIDQQLRSLIKRNSLPAPGSFLKHSIVNELGGFDEKFPFFEDYPFYLKALCLKKRIVLVREILVDYRVYNQSISNDDNFNLSYQRSVKLFFKDVFLRLVLRNRMYLYCFHYVLEYGLLILVSRRIIRRRKVYNTILSILSPVVWKSRFSKLFIR
ncbi:MAG: glycosyltransferase [Breznakibacter sp.]